MTGTISSYMDENAGLPLAHENSPWLSGSSAQPIENERKNSRFQSKTKTIDENGRTSPEFIPQYAQVMI